MNDFKNKNSYEKRFSESKSVMEKYKDRLPIIVLKSQNCSLPDVDKCKYLVPKDMTMGQFLFVVRKRIKLGPEQALFITVNGTLVSSVKTIGDIYCDLSDEDGFLYVIYTNENTFG